MKDLLIVGSVPLQTPTDVFELCRDHVCDSLACMPDGETGERIWWTNFLAYRCYHGHPDIETLLRPDTVDGIPQWMPVGLQDMWNFKVKDGVTTLRLGDPGYAGIAIDSYRAFESMQQAGSIPQDLRFMFALPLTNSATDVFFRDPVDYPIIHPAYEDLARRTIDKMLEYIPPDKLVIQWDVCVEVLDIEGLFPWTPADNKFDRNTEAAPLASHIPDSVQMGYHLCYGTLGGWPMLPPANLDVCTRMSNTLVSLSGRRVDYVHMPAPRDVDDSYFAPLADLNIGDTKVYLGVIHAEDDVDAHLQRIEIAKRHLPQFGIAGVCGFGRHRREDMPDIFTLQRQVLEAM